MDTRKTARHGDYSQCSFLHLELIVNGITVQCFPCETEGHTEPNPMFYDHLLGGRSVATWLALWNLYNHLNTDQHQRGLIPSDSIEGNRLLIKSTDNLTVMTQDMYGKYGVEVFIRKKSDYYLMLLKLYRAIEKDNAVDPNLNALRPHT